MPVTSKKQEKYMTAIAHGWKPTRGGPGPSPAVAREMLGYKPGRGGGAPTKAERATERRRRKERKDTDSTPRSRRRAAARGAMRGYEREGGMWDKIKHLIAGGKKAKELTKKSHNPGY